MFSVIVCGFGGCGSLFSRLFIVGVCCVRVCCVCFVFACAFALWSFVVLVVLVFVYLLVRKPRVSHSSPLCSTTVFVIALADFSS